MDDSKLEEIAIALNASREIGRDAACKLSTEPEAWLEGGDPDALAARFRVPARAIREARECSRAAQAVARRERRRSRDLGAEIVSLHGCGYPRPLRDLDLPPPVLYVRGSLPEEPALAIVGSRKADPYGIQAAERFAGDLAGRGLTIVSGLALGIDSAAHRAALSAGGTTVAILGCGLDVDYPRSNRRLRERIAESGALVSEFPIGMPPEAHHFPIRNRIIAALGCGTLVVRGTPRSGSLITAGLALGLGRQVWAVPGNIFNAKSKGPNSLIRDGAHPVQSPEELVETLPTEIQQLVESGGEKGAAPPERTDLARLYHAVPEGETVDAGALVAATGLALEELLALLVELEIMGFLKRLPGPVWGRFGFRGDDRGDRDRGARVE